MKRSVDKIQMDYYQILKLPRDATQDEIRDAYLLAAKRLHLDANPDPEAREQYKAVQETYNILSNPERRIGYNQSLPPPPLPAQIKTSVVLSKNLLAKSSDPQLVYALVSINSPEEPDRSLLPPAHVVLVIDRSASMQGERIEMVKLCTAQLLKKLKPQDLVSIVIFSDRAEILIPPTVVTEVDKVANRLSLIKTGGGTELAQGLRAGIDLLVSPIGIKYLKQLILVTDGHTFGDESACIELAEQCLFADISIDTLGIGHEWNDALLDEIALKTGGNSSFIQSPEDLMSCYEKIVTSLLLVYARSLRLEYFMHPDVELRYAFRIYPDSCQITKQSSLMLGDLLYNNYVDFILEFLVRDSSLCGDEVEMLKGKIWMDIIGRNEGIARQYFNINLPVRQTITVESPPGEIIDAMAFITLYRLQEKARKNVGEGKVALATRHLKYLATNLSVTGNKDLAHTVLVEVDNIRDSKGFSIDGDKKIKYGTRSLLQELIKG